MNLLESFQFWCFWYLLIKKRLQSFFFIKTNLLKIKSELRCASKKTILGLESEDMELLCSANSFKTTKPQPSRFCCFRNN